MGEEKLANYIQEVETPRQLFTSHNIAVRLMYLYV